jgi:endoglucanase Acf2
MRSALLAAALVLLAGTLAWAEEVVPAGKGSYASAPPPWTEDLDHAKPVTEAARKFHILKPDDRPIPTNQWHTHLFINGGKGGELWADPIMVKLQDQGTELYNGTVWNQDGGGMDRGQPLKLGGKGFKAADTSAKEWSDWLLQYRTAGDAQTYYDVTVGRGMPCVWVEYTGVQPVLTVGNGATFFDVDGKAGPLPARGNAFGVTFGKALWAVFAPENTAFEGAGNTVTVTFADDQKYLIFALLSDKKDMATYAKIAYAIPRKTTLSWKYDKTAGEVKQTWTVATESLKGNQKEILQGFIPHHYRTTKLGFKFTGPEYNCPRGKIKTAVGNAFDITYPFSGMLPMQPAPQVTGLANDFDPARMKDFLDKYTTREKLIKDGTYWGGKELLQWGQFMNVAAQLRDPTAAEHEKHLKATLSDWLTYTPGGDKQQHDRIFFYYYPNFKGLVGWHEEFWSYQFTDHHFHYGYFTMAAALLGLQDPQWLKDYGPMITLVAKEYANWDHNDKRFPFFRCFDVWEGHSIARGLVPVDGTDQESSSEACQAWGGLFLLGAALGDEDMTAAGAMGWCCESQAVQEYWFNKYGDVWSPNFTKPMVGMVKGAGHAYANFFTADMAWTYGIQLMPNSPALHYFAQDPDFWKKHWQKMMKSTRQTETPDAAILDKMGAGLGNVMLAHSGYFDPEWTVKTMADLIASKSALMDPLAIDNEVPAPGGLVYFNAHSLRSLGRPQFNYHTSLPMSAVYYNEKTKVYTYAACNPSDKPVEVTVYADGKTVGTFLAAPRTMTVAQKLGK